MIRISTHGRHASRHSSSRLLLLVTLIVLLIACGSPAASNPPGDQAQQALPTATERQPTPLPATPATAVEPTPTFTAAPTAVEPTAAAPTAGEPTATIASTPTPVLPTAVPSETPTVPAPTASPLLSTSDVQRITPAEATSLLDGGEAVLYDARSVAAYDALHAAGALSFPEGDAAARIDELPTDKSLIFY
jgi:hypothetical protein